MFSADWNMPHVFLYLTTEGGIPIIHTLHYPTQYAAALGITTLWNNSKYVFATNISRGIVMTINWPGATFNWLPNVQVPQWCTWMLL
jgi:hypothetical protein